MSKYIEEIRKEFPSKYIPYPFQKKIIEGSREYPGSLLRMDVGTGKTIVSWFSALGASLHEGVQQILIVCPPTISTQWFEFISEFENILSICLYEGTVEQRKKLNLSEAVIIMGQQIFLNDFKKIYEKVKKRKIFIIADEMSFRSIKTKTYKNFRKLVYNKDRTADLTPDTEHAQRLMILNATPLSRPDQIYGYTKFTSPRLYPSLKMFEDLHIVKKDLYGRAAEYKNLDLLEENFKYARFDAKADELLDLPDIVYVPIKYKLSQMHMAMYRTLAAREIKKFNRLAIGNEVSLSRMLAEVQLMVTNPEMFDCAERPAYLDLLDTRLEEIGDEKVIIFAHRKDTNRFLMKYLNGTAVGLWSEYTAKQKEKSKVAFRGNVNRMVAHCKSGGVGLNIQFARHEIFVQLPPDPPTFRQSVGRVRRDGQKKKQFITIFIAKNTIQERIYYGLICKDKLLTQVIGDMNSLENFLLP